MSSSPGFHVLRGDEHDLDVREDIDSYYIAASSLKAFQPALCTNICLSNPNSRPSENTKAHLAYSKVPSQSKKTHGADGSYYYNEFILGGYGRETVYVIRRVDSGIKHPHELNAWHFQERMTLAALSMLPPDCNTRRRMNLKVRHFGDTILKVYREDWVAFAEAVDKMLRQAKYVTTYFYKAMHGLVGIPQDVIQTVVVHIKDPSAVLFVQMHHCSEISYEGSLITFKYGRLKNMTSEQNWQRSTRYVKYFLKTGLGHFSGIRSVTDYRKITYVQGYDTRAHLLRDKRTPYSWLLELFNGFRMAQPGSRFSKLGVEIKNADDARKYYVEQAVELGLGARLEIVVTHMDFADLKRALQGGRTTMSTLREELFSSGAIVVVPSFCSDLKRVLVDTEIYEMIDPIQPRHSGSVMPRERLHEAHDRATMFHVWLQGLDNYTDTQRYQALRIHNEGKLYRPHKSSSGLDLANIKERAKIMWKCPTQEFHQHLHHHRRLRDGRRYAKPTDPPVQSHMFTRYDRRLGEAVRRRQTRTR